MHSFCVYVGFVLLMETLHIAGMVDDTEPGAHPATGQVAPAQLKAQCRRGRRWQQDVLDEAVWWQAAAYEFYTITFFYLMTYRTFSIVIYCCGIALNACASTCN